MLEEKNREIRALRNSEDEKFVLEDTLYAAQSKIQELQA